MSKETAYCVIMTGNKILNGLLFDSILKARNYIKFTYHKRTFKEPELNVFVCTRYGTHFKIIELTKHD